MINKNIKVRNSNGTYAVISAAVVVQYLKDYTSDWGSVVSTSARIADIESEFAPVEGPDKDYLEKFNSKIGFILPVTTLDSLIEEVIDIIQDTDDKYLTMFQSFNNLEKVAIYFILMLQSRSVSEIFDLITANYKDISKRDVMIRLLTENEVEETDNTIGDPLNGLYKLLSTAKTHNVSTEPVFSYDTVGSNTLEFKEFTFPMHSYNLTKRYGNHEISDSDNVRNYYEQFNSAWYPNGNLSRFNGWFNSNSALYKKDHWKNIFLDSVISDISASSNGITSQPYKVIKDIRDLLNYSATSGVYFSASSEKPLFEYLGEKLLSMSHSPSYSPLGMGKYISDNNVTKYYFNRDLLKAGDTISYDNDFNNLKTVLSYYASDINFWFTSDDSSDNTSYSDYKYNITTTSFLPSNGLSETKGYFSNTMFIQNAIQRVLYPKILKLSQGGYTNSSSNDIFETDEKVYETIFDSIVNNSFVYTDKDATSTSFESNYEIIPNRINLSNEATNNNATNLYEFIINSIVSSKDNVNSKNRRVMTSKEDINNYNRQDLLYKYPINYNPINDRILTTPSSLTISDFDTNSLTYNFGTPDIYNPTNNNWIDKMMSTFFKMDNEDSYSKINYRDFKFFKLPTHSSDDTVVEELNRNINRVDRELLTDLSDIAMYDIEGLSLGDFTYAEKALLKEYIKEFSSIRLMKGQPEMKIIKSMLTHLSDLKAWKASRTNVQANNVYYIASVQNSTSSLYFPESLTAYEIDAIEDLLNRSIFSVKGNRNYSKNSSFEAQLKEFVKNSAVKAQYIQSGYSIDKNMSATTIGTNFLNSMRFIITSIQKTDEYESALDTFTTAYQQSVWSSVTSSINGVRDALINGVEGAIEDSGIYNEDKHLMLKDLDIALYKQSIYNYFEYLIDSNTRPVKDISSIVFTDNKTTGIIRYYNDLILLARFIENYLDLVPKYVFYLENVILTKFYKRIGAVKALPTWDYESLHRRDEEVSLKAKGGINAHDYNLVWPRTTATGSNNISIIFKGKNPWRYKVSNDLYKGGLSNTASNNKYRDLWWRRWLKDGEPEQNSEIITFKIPYIDIRDNNIARPSIWTYDSPDDDWKKTYFYRMKDNNFYYQKGKVASISAFKYGMRYNTYHSIGVPILLMGDDGSEWNKPNTTRENSFSFETDFLNMWHTDEGNESGESYTRNGHELVSGSDKFTFGLGDMDIQEMFTHYWNMESSPMATPYNVMNYNIFDNWDEEYSASEGDFPWSTVTKTIITKYVLGLVIKSITSTKKLSNKYDFKFVLNKFDADDKWSPVRLSGEDRSIGVDPEITTRQIRNNFYWSSNEKYSDTNQLAMGVFDVYNRNFRNRVYLSYLRWRYLYNQGEW